MDEWHYVVGVLDGNKMRKYVNGTLEAETDFVGKIRKNAVDPVHIARYGFAGGYFVNGALDELTIYAKALSDAEIQINFTGEGLATQVQPRGKLPTVWATLKRQNGLGR
jgi:antitoxin component YwqK of YwqJK toxin-antitoxin module